MTTKRKKVTINSNFTEFSTTIQWSESCDHCPKMFIEGFNVFYVLGFFKTWFKKVIANQKKCRVVSIPLGLWECRKRSSPHILYPSIFPSAHSSIHWSIMTFLFNSCFSQSLHNIILKMHNKRPINLTHMTVRFLPGSINSSELGWGLDYAFTGRHHVISC